jgi:hypothetical protein
VHISWFTQQAIDVQWEIACCRRSVGLRSNSPDKPPESSYMAIAHVTGTGPRRELLRLGTEDPISNNWSFSTMKFGTCMIAFAISTVLIGAAPLAARAKTPGADAPALGRFGASGTVKMTATVVSIDMGSRDLLLIDSQGKMHKVNVSDQVRNLDQVKVGDKVSAEYTEAISLQLKKRGTADGSSASAVEAMIRSPKGAKPGAAVGRKVTAFATIEAVNSTKQFVTLRGPLGNDYDVQVLDPAQLNAVKKGDEVEVVYTEELAISVQPAPGPK